MQENHHAKLYKWNFHSLGLEMISICAFLLQFGAVAIINIWGIDTLIFIHKLQDIRQI